MGVEMETHLYSFRDSFIEFFRLRMLFRISLEVNVTTSFVVI